MAESRTLAFLQSLRLHKSNVRRLFNPSFSLLRSSITKRRVDLTRTGLSTTPTRVASVRGDGRFFQVNNGQLLLPLLRGGLVPAFRAGLRSPHMSVEGPAVLDLAGGSSQDRDGRWQ